MTYKELGKQSPILRKINTGYVNIVSDLNALRVWIDENTFIEEGDSHEYRNMFNLSNGVVNKVLRCIAYICDGKEKVSETLFAQEVIKTVCEFIATFKLDDCYDTWQHQLVDSLQCFNVIENESSAKMLITIISDPENKEARIAVHEYLHEVICCWKPYTVPMVYNNKYSVKAKYALAAAVALHKEIEHGVYSPWAQYIECDNINKSILPGLCNAGCASLSNPTEMSKYAAMLAFYFITNKERLQNLYDLFFKAE